MNNQPKQFANSSTSSSYQPKHTFSCSLEDKNQSINTLDSNNQKLFTRFILGNLPSNTVDQLENMNP